MHSNYVELPSGSECLLLYAPYAINHQPCHHAFSGPRCPAQPSAVLLTTIACVSST